MPNFIPNQRVVYKCPDNPNFPSAQTFASWGDKDRVMHLNARDEEGRILPITGTILRVAHIEENGNVTYSFKPDGWPDDTKFAGFQAPEDHFSAIYFDTFQPGTITDRRGNKEKL